MSLQPPNLSNVDSVIRSGNFGFPNPVPTRFSGEGRGLSGFVANRLSASVCRCSAGTLPLKRAIGTISEVRYHRWWLNADKELSETIWLTAPYFSIC